MNQLEEKRIEIDAIDKEMARLFERRMEACRGIAEYKRAHALPICDPAREAAVVAAASERVADPTMREYYTSFVKDVMKTSRAYQSRLTDGMRVVYSGAEGAFGYIAASRAFPGASLEACADFADAYHSVEEGSFDCAVLPIENSYAGDVGAVMDLIFSGSLYINRMIDLEVEHSLLGVPGTAIEDIETVVSHPQALEQCADFIRAHGWKTVSYSNTALAAKYVAAAGDRHIAAIASDETAELYGLCALAHRINSARSNTTRFAVLSRAQHLPSPESRTGREHFILVFTTKNEAGALAQPLNIIGAHNFNMRGLRSRPMKDLIWNYYFFVEADGNISTDDGKNMLRELSAVCAELRLAGTYEA